MSLHLALAATGATFNWWIPVVAGVLLLGGIVVLVISIVNRRRANSVPEPVEGPKPVDSADLPPASSVENTTPENPAP